MSDGVWRNFRFFESEAVPPACPLAELNAVCSCLSPTAIVIGDYEGQVFLLDRHAPCAVVCSFQAYAGAVTHVRYAAARNALVTIGDDDALNTAILRVWELDHLLNLYRGLMDNGTSSSSSTGPAQTTTALKWRPPCQEHRLLPATAKNTMIEDLPRVPILLQVSKQLQYTFRPSAGASPPPPLSQVGGGGVAEDAAAVSCGSIRSVVVSLDVTPNLSCAAVGLATRDCIVLRGDLAKERAVRMQTIRSGLAKGALTFVALPSPQHATLLEGTKAAAAGQGEAGVSGGGGGFFSGRAGGITAWGTAAAGAAASPSPSQPAATGGVQLLFTVHEDVVTCWALRANGNWSEYPCPTFGGAPLGGATLTARGELLLLGKQSVTHAAGSRIVRLGPALPTGTNTSAPSSSSPLAYDPTVKGSVVTFDLDHAPGRCFLYPYRHYLALLVQQEGRPDQFQLQCYDLAYKIRGLSRQQENYVNCASVLSDERDLLVLFQDPAQRNRQLSLRGVCLHEVATQTKLELLFSKECYGIAQQLAQTVEGGDPSLQLRIRKKYGDYLYNKGKPTEAMTQYVETIGHLESSYVIRRYMGSAHMADLIRYLEELHHQRHSAHANVAHTTLLLKCYHKSGAADRLTAFVHRDDVRFDPQNAVAVCREGGHAEAALYVADRYAQVYDCARIRLYDLRDPAGTLAYLRTLGVDEVEGICAQLGKDLLALAPRATTELLMELCVYWKGPGRRLLETGSGNGGGSVAAAAVGGLSVAETSAAGGVAGLSGPRHTHHANAAAFLHIFVDTPVCLMNFLRAVVESGVLDEDESGGAAAGEAVAAAALASPHAVLFNTLLELYMTRTLHNTLQLVPTRAGSATTPAAEDFPAEPYERRLEQARTFLEAYKGRYDDYLALSLAHQHHFQDGILYLLRSLGLSEEVLHYYSAKLNDPHTTPAERQEATGKIFQACQESPAGNSGTAAMWMTLLSQLVRTPATELQDMVKVLDYIEAHDALSPVVVLEILSSNPQSTLQLRTVRDYCQRCLLKQTRQVQQVLATTAQRLGEVEQIKAQVTALQTSAVVFQTTACAHCHQPLDAPSVFFMCKHAFHHRCLYTATECNLCAAAHRRQLDAIREAQQRDQQRHNPSSFTAQFFEDVKAGRCKKGVQMVGAGGESAATEQQQQQKDVPDGFQVVADYVARGVLGAPPLYKDAGLFSVEAAMPLRSGGGGARRDAEAAVNAEDLEVW